MTEEWRPIVCQDIRVGWYEVSNLLDDFDSSHPNFNMNILINDTRSRCITIMPTISKAATYIGKNLNMSRELIYDLLQHRERKIEYFQITYSK